MLINEVEHLVGLSKKTIRYYEELGLLKTKRQKENNYRLYTDENVAELRLIKFLRELNVPINEIQKLQENKLTLNDCLKDRLKKISAEEENYRKIKNMCQDIITKNYTYNNIDVNKYFTEMTILNKKGFSMRQNEDIKKKRITGAILSSLFFTTLLGITLAILWYFQLTEKEQMPLIIILFFTFILVIPIIGTIYNLILRIKEILKGEEDEASKY